MYRNDEIQKIADQLLQKTKADVISWKCYDCLFDTNLFSKKYFSTIPSLDARNGFVAKLDDGYIYLVSDFVNQHGLFLQAKQNYIPVCVNYENGSLLSNPSINTLFEFVSKPFDDLNSFVNKIIE